MNYTREEVEKAKKCSSGIFKCNDIPDCSRVLAAELERVEKELADWKSKCGPWFPWDSQARKRLSEAESKVAALTEKLAESDALFKMQTQAVDKALAQEREIVRLYEGEKDATRRVERLLQESAEKCALLSSALDQVVEHLESGLEQSALAEAVRALAATTPTAQGQEKKA